MVDLRKKSAIWKSRFKIATLFASSLSLLVTTEILLSQRPAHAQVNLYPLVLQEETERGQARAVINVANTSDQPFRARITAEPFTYTQADGFTTLEPGSSGDLTPYLFFSPTELVVPPNSERRIRMITQFPPSAEPGEYRAVIFTEPLRATSPEDGTPGVNVITRVAATLYVRNGDLSPEIVVGSALWDREAQQVQMVVDNVGEASVRPVAQWTLRQGDMIIALGQSCPTAIMPESKRNFLLDYSTQEVPILPSGTYELSGEFVWRDGSDDEQTQSFEVELQIPVGN
ncbi:MAG: P pilus assembly protein, chaperone PapD [Cyanobacteria bacterium J06635_1]